MVRRRLTIRNIEEFTRSLAKESLNDVLNQSDVSASLKALMDSFLYFYETAFPYKKKVVSNLKSKNCLSMGLIIGSKKKNWVNILKKSRTFKHTA